MTATDTTHAARDHEHPYRRWGVPVNPRYDKTDTQGDGTSFYAKRGRTLWEKFIRWLAIFVVYFPEPLVTRLAGWRIAVVTVVVDVVDVEATRQALAGQRWQDRSRSEPSENCQYHDLRFVRRVRLDDSEGSRSRIRTAIRTKLEQAAVIPHQIAPEVHGIDYSLPEQHRPNLTPSDDSSGLEIAKLSEAADRFSALSIFGPPEAAHQLWGRIAGELSHQVGLKSTSVEEEIKDAREKLRYILGSALVVIPLTVGAWYAQPRLARLLGATPPDDDLESWAPNLVAAAVIIIIATGLVYAAYRERNRAVDEMFPDEPDTAKLWRRCVPTRDVRWWPQRARRRFFWLVSVGSCLMGFAVFLLYWSMQPDLPTSIEGVLGMVGTGLAFLVIFGIGRSIARRSRRHFNIFRAALVPTVAVGFGMIHTAALAIGAEVPYGLVAGGPIDLVIGVWKPLLTTTVSTVVFGALFSFIAPRTYALLATVTGLALLGAILVEPVEAVGEAYLSGRQLAAGIAPTWYQPATVRAVCAAPAPAPGQPLPRQGGRPMWAWGPPDGSPVLSVRRTSAAGDAQPTRETEPRLPPGDVHTALITVPATRVVLLPPTACG